MHKQALGTTKSDLWTEVNQRLYCTILLGDEIVAIIIIMTMMNDFYFELYMHNFNFAAIAVTIWSVLTIRLL